MTSEQQESFRPWRPSSWPSVFRLLVALFVITCVKLGGSERVQVPTTAIYLLITVVAIKIKSNIDARRHLFKVFERGNVPSVPNTSLISGNLFEIIVPKRNIDVIEAYHQKLGKIYGFFYGKDPWILTTDLDLLQYIFVTEGNKFIDMTQMQLPFVEEWNESLVQIKGDLWRQTRRILSPPFAHRQMKTDNVYEDISRVCRKLLGCFDGHPVRKSAELGQPDCRIVDVLYNSKKYSLDVIFQMAFGVENGVNMEPEQKDPLVENIDKAALLVRGPIVWMSIMFHESQKFIGFLSKFSPMGHYLRYIHRVLDKSLAERRNISERLEKHERKMIDTIIQCGDSNKMTNTILKANLFFFLLAGFETSANTLACLLWLLAQHQTIQDKLREELVRDGDQSEYLVWCLKETLRLYPAVPAGIGRILSEDLEYKGMKFFKGTTVNASIYSIHHSAEYWGDDPETFRPERFGQLKLHPAQYFAFGLGPRYCMGAHLAMSELQAAGSQILLKYRLEPCEQTPDKIDFITPNMIHMIIKHPLPLKFIELSCL